MSLQSACAKLLPGVEVIDAHGHIGLWSAPGSDGSIDELQRMLDISGFSKVVISSANSITYDVSGGNREIAEAVARDERIFGAVAFNANYPRESREEILRYAEHPRFVCAKIHPGHMGIGIDHPDNMKLYELLAKFKLPLTAHTWTGDGPCAAKVARELPELVCIWYHALADDYRLAAELATDLPNVYLEYAVSRQIPGKVETLVEIAGADKVLFGTDQTLINPVYALGPTLEARISESDRRKVLSENARKVFDFEKS